MVRIRSGSGPSGKRQPFGLDDRVEDAARFEDGQSDVVSDRSDVVEEIAEVEVGHAVLALRYRETVVALENSNLGSTAGRSSPTRTVDVAAAVALELASDRPERCSVEEPPPISP